MDELDPRKLYELSESLNELTGTVKGTSQALQSMLGPQAQANDKLKISSEERIKVESEANRQREKEVNTESSLDSRQQKLFNDELRWRGYQLDKIGNLTKTTISLTAAQQQAIEALDKRIAQERELAAVVKDPVKSFRNISGSVNSLDGVMGILQDKMFEMTGKNTVMAGGLVAATAVIGGVTKAAMSMAESLYNGERGAKVGAKAAKELSDSVTKAMFGIGAVLMLMPGLGLVAKAAGLALGLFAAATQGATKLIEMGAKYNDDVYDSFNQLSESGLTTAQGMSGVSNTMEKLGVTSSQIEKMNSLLTTNSKDLALFGGTAAGGLEKFSQVAGTIAHPASELNKKLLLLGITSDEQREHTLKYMATQTRMGMLQNKTQADQIKGATAYMEELDRIATITGIGRKEQEEAQKQVLAIEELRAAMYQAEKSGDTKRQSELEAAFKYSSRLMAEGRKKEAAGFAKYVSAGKNVIDNESAAAIQSSRGAMEAIESGKSPDEVYEAGLVTSKEALRRVAGTKRIGGDVSSQVLDFNASLDAVKSSENAQAEMAKLGIKDRAEYAKYLQNQKLTKPDPQLLKNVEVAQIQQKTGLILDQAARKMDGAGLAMAASVKAFNEAVGLFNKAAGGTPQGADVEKAKQQDDAALEKQRAAIEANNKIKQDANATKEQKQAAQKAEDDANKASQLALAKKREAFLKEQNELRELNKKQRSSGKQVFKNMEEARAAGAAPKPGPAPVAPTTATETAPKTDTAVAPTTTPKESSAPADTTPKASPTPAAPKPEAATTPVTETKPATTPVPSTSTGAPEPKPIVEPKPVTESKPIEKLPVKQKEMGESSELSKIEKEITRFTGSNNMQLQSNKEYVAKLEAKRKEIAQLGKERPEPAKPESKPVAPAPSTTGGIPEQPTKITKQLIANEPVFADKPLSDRQLHVIEFGLGQGNTYPDEILKKYNLQKTAPVTLNSGNKNADPDVDINKAANGGIFSGPGSKNPVMLNSSTMAMNDILLSLKDSFTKVEQKSVESELPELTKPIESAPVAKPQKSNSITMLEELTYIMEQKMSDVISAISDNNDIKEEILLYSKV